MLRFAYLWIFALAPGPLVIRWLLPSYREARDAVRLPVFVTLETFTGREAGPGAAIRRRTYLQTLLYVVVWAMLVAALARPQWLEPPVVRRIPTRDLLLAVDLPGSMEATDFESTTGQTVDRLSAVKEVLDEFLDRRDGDRVGLVVLRVAESMTATDLPPTRLERARHKLQDLAGLREGGAMGLIAYDGSAHLVMPMTRDSRVVVDMAQALEPGVMPLEGDALADAFDLAQGQLDQAGTPGSVLVITDGVSPEQATRLHDEGGGSMQFLAIVGSAELAEQGGVTAAAKTLGAELELASVDDSDMRAISRRAESMARSANAEDQDRLDEGYLLIVPLLLGALWWTRRGWSVPWE